MPPMLAATHLDAGSNAVELGVGVPGGVLYVGRAPPNVSSHQPNALPQRHCGHVSIVRVFCAL